MNSLNRVYHLRHLWAACIGRERRDANVKLASGYSCNMLEQSDAEGAEIEEILLQLAQGLITTEEAVCALQYRQRHDLDLSIEPARTHTKFISQRAVVLKIRQHLRVAWQSFCKMCAWTLFDESVFS
jgi:hypothetical protein